MEDFERCLLVKSEVPSFYAALHKTDYNISLYVICFQLISFVNYLNLRKIIICLDFFEADIDTSPGVCVQNPSSTVCSGLQVPFSGKWEGECVINGKPEG